MTDQIIVAARFNGPPDSGNGGYTAGLVAAALGAERTGAVVTLRTPPPLDTPLRVHTAGREITVCHGDTLVVEAAATDLDDEPAAPVAYDEAVTAAAAYPGFSDHPFPTCYVCGPQRAAGDGLRIFPGPLPGSRTAAPWTVPSGADAVTLWAALDCPGGWSIIAPGRPYVLGRMAAMVRTVPPDGVRCVATGATAEVEGRKAVVRSALYREDGTLLAQARSTWIAI
jgi:hypothetical protein